jgi:hypothetical protein
MRSSVLEGLEGLRKALHMSLKFSDFPIGTDWQLW